MSTWLPWRMEIWGCDRLQICSLCMPNKKEGEKKKHHEVELLLSTREDRMSKRIQNIIELSGMWTLEKKIVHKHSSYSKWNFITYL